jgi:(S)-mandelate dehydrogenase
MYTFAASQDLTAGLNKRMDYVWPRQEKQFRQWPANAVCFQAQQIEGLRVDIRHDLWDDVKTLRDAWPGKLILKGIVHPADAERAVAAGCDGVVVSNHGGRQLDGAIATADALPLVARAAGSRLTVLVDGGVRRGVDLLKARALGAQAALTGRATLFGVMAGGDAGAKRAIEILAGEFERAMMLCGVARAIDISAELLAP